jgi:competence protein ComEC
MIIKGSLSMPVVLCLVFILVMSPIFKKATNTLLWLLVLCVPILSSPWAYQVTLISVGQGDAILLQAPFNQEVVLIDTGKESAYGQVGSFLNAQGISKLDVLIVTHDDNDHSANFEQIKLDYDVMRSVIRPEDMDLNWFHLKSLKTSLENPTDNQASLVYLFEINELRFLMMADADDVTEADLIRQYPKLKADVLKVGHHGSASSASDVFLSTIQAKLALISVGYNTYGHPSFQTLERLKDHRLTVMNTRDEGDITLILSSFWNGLKTSSLNLKTLKLDF